MHKLLVTRILPSVAVSQPNTPPDNADCGDKSAADATTEIEKPVSQDGGVLQDGHTIEAISSRATLLVASHLLNPLVFSISTRGSSESVLSLFVLATLYFAYGNQWDAAAILLGLSTHWKIYPFVYGVACLGVIGGGASTSWFARLITWRGVRFACISAGTFTLLGAAMYAM